jgi:uncharacterized membrane protein
METLTCAISGKECTAEHAVPLSALHQTIQQYVFRNYPGTTTDSIISDEQLINLEKNYLNEILTNELGELDDLEKEVLNSISQSKILSEKIEDIMDEETTFGDRLSDKVASFGGSWKFIIAFFSFMAFWIVLNVVLLHDKVFDPYPFILLNLLLSCLASIQAPLIMMSQNRVEAKDRTRSEHDYKINLKSELEIQLLHKKIDHLLIHQNKHLLEMQRIQAEMMETISRSFVENKNSNPSA